MVYALLTEQADDPADLDRFDAGLVSTAVDAAPAVDRLAGIDDEALDARAQRLIAGRF